MIHFLQTNPSGPKNRPWKSSMQAAGFFEREHVLHLCGILFHFLEHPSTGLAQSLNH